MLNKLELGGVTAIGLLLFEALTLGLGSCVHSLGRSMVIQLGGYGTATVALVPCARAAFGTRF